MSNQRIHGLAAQNIGSEYTDAEREFMMALDCWRVHHHDAHPDCRDVLRVARRLGYRKIAPAALTPSN